jgi:hypothetical protein
MGLTNSVKVRQADRSSGTMMLVTQACVRPMEVAQVGRRTSPTTAVRMPVRLGAAPKLAAACVGLRAESAIAHAGAALSNGAKVVMMRHKCKVPRLSRPADQRKVRRGSPPSTAANRELGVVAMREGLRHGRVSGLQRRSQREHACDIGAMRRTTTSWVAPVLRHWVVHRGG